MSEKFKLTIFGGLILRRGSQTLLIKRASNKLQGGLYAFPGGSTDGNESMTAATVREAAEEIGVTLDPKNLKFAHVVHVKSKPDVEWVNFFFEATTWNGKPHNMEPHKCSHVGWFDIDNLPKELMPLHQHVIKAIMVKSFYSEFGW